MCGTIKEAKGIYRRGRIYWYKWQENGQRKYVSLETEDPFVALQRAGEVCSAPHLQSSQGLLRDINRYLESKRKLNPRNGACDPRSAERIRQPVRRDGNRFRDSCISRRSLRAPAKPGWRDHGADPHARYGHFSRTA